MAKACCQRCFCAACRAPAASVPDSQILCCFFPWCALQLHGRSAAGAAGAGPAARRSWSPPPSASGQPPQSQQTGTVCFCRFALDSINDLFFFMTEYLYAPVTGSNVRFQTNENSHYQVTRVWKELTLLGGGKSKRGNIIPPAIALTSL